MSEPVNVTEPMSAPSTTKIVVSSGAPELSRMKSSMATRAAAPPPTALNSDTSCGIAVIFTVRAVYRPAPPPIRNPTTMMASAVALEAAFTGDQVDERRPDGDDHAGRAEPVAVAAVAGEFIRWRPSTKQAAPASQAR